MKNILILLIIIVSFSPTQTQAALSPLSVNIVPPLQFPPSNFDVTGLRINGIWGKHRKVYGFDLSILGSIVEQGFTGVSIAGGFNYYKGRGTILGLQLAGVTNMSTEQTTVLGVQAAGLVNYGQASSDVYGLQIATLANLSGHSKIVGMQLGLYNKANRVYGLQVGLINSATSLHGIQIGLLNFHKEGIFSVSPIINIGF